MSQNFVVSADVIVRINQEGNLEIVGKGLQTVTQAEKDVGAAVKTTSGFYNSQAYLVRRLAMDLRMLSIGLMILKREYGGINPVIDATISALYQGSAAVSVVLASIGILERSWKLLGLQGKSLTGIITGISAALKGGAVTLGIATAAIAAAVAGSVILGSAQFETTSGVSRLRTEIRGLEEDLKGLNSEMRNLQVTQSDLNAESAKNRYAIAMLKREIELTGDPTGALGVQMKALESSAADLDVASKGLGWTIADQGAKTAHATDQVKDYQEQIDVAWKAGIQALLSSAPPGLPPSEYTYGVPQEQLGGEVRRSGVVSVEAGEVIMQREQVATMMVGGNVGGGPVSVSISLAGANITGVKDLVSALKSGGAAAANEIRRLELMRKKVRSRP